MDVGANDGSSSLKLAKQFPERIIFAMDPIEGNVRRMFSKLFHYPNVRILHGALGEENGFGKYADKLDQRHARSSQIGIIANYDSQKRYQGHKNIFPVYTVDELFGKKYRLAFGHWDVEGSEVFLLRGAEKTIRRDRPFFSVETFPFTNKTRHTELLRKVHSLNYTCVQIDEVCGWPTDCRNLLCSPNEVRHDEFQKVCPHTSKAALPLA